MDKYRLSPWVWLTGAFGCALSSLAIGGELGSGLSGIAVVYLLIAWVEHSLRKDKERHNDEP